jgi:hypothetical protein
VQEKLKRKYKEEGSAYIDNFSLTKRVVECLTIGAARSGGVDPYLTGAVSLFGTDVPAHVKNFNEHFPGLKIRVSENNKQRYNLMKEYAGLYPNVSFHYGDVFDQPISNLVDLDFEGSSRSVYSRSLQCISKQKFVPGPKCFIINTCCRPHGRDEELRLHTNLYNAVGIYLTRTPTETERMDSQDPGASLKRLIIPRSTIVGPNLISLDVYLYARKRKTGTKGIGAHMMTTCLVYR